jgi:hypothetical protein
VTGPSSPGTITDDRDAEPSWVRSTATTSLIPAEPAASSGHVCVKAVAVERRDGSENGRLAVRICLRPGRLVSFLVA